MPGSAACRLSGTAREHASCAAHALGTERAASSWQEQPVEPSPLHRGAHTFFLKTREVPRWGGYTVNLIHYEDAARLSAAVSRRKCQEAMAHSLQPYDGSCAHPCMCPMAHCKASQGPAALLSQPRQVSDAFSTPYLTAVLSLLPQILAGDGSDSYYRSKVFLGTDGSPITFTVRAC